MFRYKHGINVLEMLKTAGYNTNRIRTERVFGQSTLQKFRTGDLPSWNELDRLCKLLKVEPWEIIEFVDDSAQD